MASSLALASCSTTDDAGRALSGAWRDQGSSAGIEVVDTATRRDDINYELIAQTEPDLIVAFNSVLVIVHENQVSRQAREESDLFRGRTMAVMFHSCRLRICLRDDQRRGA